MLLQDLLAILSGGLVGLLLGATGGGGSLIAIPLLVYVVSVPVQSATAMSLIVVGYSALFGAWRKSREGQVRGTAAFMFSATGAMGAWIGAQGHRLVQGEIILILFGVMMVGIGIATFRRRGVERRDPSEEGCSQKFTFPCLGKALGIGFGVGLLTGFFGIGGGFLIVPALVFVLGFPFRLAVGTSLMIIALTSLGGIAGHLRVGAIDPSLTALLIVGSLLGMLVGTRLARTLREQMLSVAFSVLTCGVGIFMVLDNGIRIIGCGP